MGRSRLFRNIWLGIENLWLHKLRSFLTMLGVVFGVGSVVAMLSVGEGASKEVLDQIEKLGSNNVIISSVKSAEDQSMSTTRSHMGIYGLTYNDYQAIVETFDTVVESAPIKITRKEGRLASRSMELRVVGTTERWFKLVERPLIAGRRLLESDNENQEAVAVLTEYGARKLLATQYAIGQSLRIGGNYFKIIGIIKSESGTAGNIQIPDQKVDVYIPIRVAKSFFGDITMRRTSGSRELEKVQLHQVIVKIDEKENVESTARGIEQMIARLHKKKDYSVSVPLALLKQAEETKRIFNIVLGSIAGISLLVGGIGIMNIMLASVTERTREIGIRRAIGAKRSQIVTQFLIETVVLSTIGGLIGVVVGVSIPFVITKFADIPTVITTTSVVLPLIISLAVGIVFGLYPAVRAAAVDPIVALRHE